MARIRDRLPGNTAGLEAMVRWFRAVAMDLDGTLTLGGWPAAPVLNAIATLRADGVRTPMVRR